MDLDFLCALFFLSVLKMIWPLFVIAIISTPQVQGQCKCIVVLLTYCYLVTN